MKSDLERPTSLKSQFHHMAQQWASLQAALEAPWKRLRQRRVPVVRQLNPFECGAACLTMILNYYGRQVDIAECRAACGVGRDGLTALTITKAARAEGLHVRTFTLDPCDLSRITLPAIVHWNFNHFVVLERWTSESTLVVDPAVGRRRISAKEFDQSFTGVVLTFEPGPGFQRREARLRSWHLYLRYALRTPGVSRFLIQVLLASLLLTLLGLAVPIFTKILVDYLLPFHLTDITAILGIGVCIAGFAQFATAYIRATLLVYLRTRFDTHLMLGFFEHVLSLPFAFFQQRSSGDLLMRLASNAIIREALTSHTISILIDSGLVLIYAVILLSQIPLFGLLALGIGAVQVALLLATTPKMHALTQQDLGRQAESQGYLVEVLRGVAVLKASGTEAQAIDRWSDLFARGLSVAMKRDRLAALIQSITATLRTFGPLLLLWVGALYVLQNDLPLGTMLALQAIAVSFLFPLASLVSAGQQLQLIGAYIERIADVVNAEPEQGFQQELSVHPLSGCIELRDISFRYDPNGAWALRHISFTVTSGQKVALVGKTGSGKSTLAKLLLGLYEPSEGDILYDDIPLKQSNYRALRQQCGVVLQESTIFGSSIRENIALHDPTIPLDEIAHAAKLAAIHDEIVDMPMGYETLASEGGAALSGGQRQRLCLARALVHRPAVLLLDEATSHLDAATEHLVIQNLRTLRCTSIVVAHRLSTIQDADLILVLDQGQIVEQGSHDDLMDQDGYYAALIRSQLPTA